MNSCRGKSEIMSFHRFFTLMGRLILHGAKDGGSFEAHVPYFINAFNGGTKVIQLEDAKLGSKGLARDKRTQRRVLLKNMPQYCHSSCHKGSATDRGGIVRGNTTPVEESREDVIMRRYDQELLGAPLRPTSQRTRPSKRTTKEVKENSIGMSLAKDGGGYAWELQSVFLSTKGNCSENTGVFKKAIERGEEATMSPEGLSYPKAKR
ncbi:hypothetical protein GW17_00056894 [Ensete ventricosum]|nr:hypothetical protein GW17_00056894 [Ensete ventricosum]